MSPGASRRCESCAGPPLPHHDPAAAVRSVPGERRTPGAAITRDIQLATGLDEAVLERLVRTFYATTRQDEVIGHLFNSVGDWEQQIARITAFWSSVGLLTGRYHGQPLAAHMPLDLEPPHFVRWLALFEAALRTVCTPEAADHLLEKAQRIARSLQLGTAVLPTPGGRAR